MTNISLDSVLDAMKKKGHDVFENDTKPFNINIVGIRNPNAKVDEFGCRMTVFWKYNSEWEFRSWPWTTLPGSTYLQRKLLNKKGCAILVPGQYKGVYALDMHNGKYEALCQRYGSVRVYRDGDRDNEFDFDPNTIQTGQFGINIHAPITPKNGLLNYIQDTVKGSSAGCQVAKNMADFLEFRELCRQSRNWFGNRFTYTLLDSL